MKIANKSSKNKEDFSGSFMHSIHVLYVTIQKRLEHVLSLSGDLSFSQFLIIMPFVNPDCSPITQAKLAECLMITEATVSRHISALVDKNYITKKHIEDNKKAYQLEVTEDGRKAYLFAKNIVHREIESAFAYIDKATQTTITKLFFETVTSLQEKE